MNTRLRHPDGLTVSERGRFAVLRWRMLYREWFGHIDADRLPGMRVRCRFGYVEIERLFHGRDNDSVNPRFGTGARMRMAGWRGPRIFAVRFAIPWRDGTLLVRSLA